MFGFSRGAFTAKFLARMINTVGLLCKGQEEMVPFAYRLYQRYLAGEVEDFNVAHPKKSKRKRNADRTDPATQPEPAPLPDGDTEPLHNGHEEDACEDPVTHGHRFEIARDEIAAFSDTFCRKEKTFHCGKEQEENIKVFFLGIWDCVNSVAVLERTAPLPMPVVGTAQHVRHAVAIDERRVKFKAALLAQDREDADHNHEDIKEVWFPGCHGDVGGGWPASKDNPFDNGKEMTFWERVRHFWTTRRNKEPARPLGAGRLQLSDVPLAWMIREVELVGEQDASAALKWRKNVHEFKAHFAKKKDHAMKGPIHDSLALGRGTSLFKVLLWKFMGKETFPLIHSILKYTVSLLVLTSLNRMAPHHQALGARTPRVGEHPLPAQQGQHARHPKGRSPPRVPALAAHERRQVLPGEQPRRSAAALPQAQEHDCRVLPCRRARTYRGLRPQDVQDQEVCV